MILSQKQKAMNSLELIDSFSEFKQMKNIDRPTMMKLLEDVFRTLTHTTNLEPGVARIVAALRS